MGNHENDEKPALGKWQLGVVIGVTALVAAVLVAYGAAGSYFSLSHLAAAHKVPLAPLAPVGLDGGLIGVIVLDIALTWAGHPLPFLRFIARFLALGTVAANLAAGWPDPIGVGLRVFAPLLIVTISESVRAVLLRRARVAQDPIPLARWLLAFPSTCRMKRRMVLWQINDYADAVDMELSRLQSIEKLSALYRGKDWRQEAPRDLVWMLRKGVRMNDALALVAKLTAPPKPDGHPVTKPRRPGVNKKTGSRVTKPRRPGVTEPPSSPLPADTRSPVTADAGSPPPADAPEDLDTMAEALRILAENPDIGGKELGRQLGKSPSYGCRLKNRLAPTVPGPDADEVGGSSS